MSARTEADGVGGLSDLLMLWVDNRISTITLANGTNVTR